MRERHGSLRSDAPLVVICSPAAELSVFLRHLLEGDGPTVELASTKDDALRKIVEQNAALALVDCQIEGALSLCRSVREARDSQTCRIVGLVGPDLGSSYTDFLSAGMDDGLMRPVEPAAILDAVRRQTKQASIRNGPVIVHQDVEIDLRGRRVWRRGREILLTRIEFELLAILASDPTCVHSRKALIADAWPRGVFVEPRTVNIHIGRLRRRLMTGGGSDLIRTVRGSGYALHGSEINEPRD